MKSLPPQYARPRLAATPKLTKRPLFFGRYSHFTLPVAPSSANAKLLFVVT